MQKQNSVSINILSCCLKISVEVKFTFREKIAKEKNMKLKNANEWPKHLRNVELKNANKLIVFGNAESKIAIDQFFMKCKNKNC